MRGPTRTNVLILLASLIITLANINIACRSTKQTADLMEEFADTTTYWVGMADSIGIYKDGKEWRLGGWTAFGGTTYRPHHSARIVEDR